MASRKGIALVLGAGQNIGRALAQKFTDAGYKIALVSRSAVEEESDQGKLVRIKADLAQPDSIPFIFATVRQKLGADPNVVIYNAAKLSAPADPKNLLTVDPAAVEADLRLMNTSPYVAAREAVAGFEKLDAGLPKAYIYTGNWLSAVSSPFPMVTTLAMGKSAASAWIGNADLAFKEKGYRFFFADERNEEGKAAGTSISGAAHADVYLELAEANSEIPWHATFVAGKGLVDFPESRRK